MVVSHTGFLAADSYGIFDKLTDQLFEDVGVSSHFFFIFQTVPLTFSLPFMTDNFSTVGSADGQLLTSTCLAVSALTSEPVAEHSFFKFESN